MTAKGEISELYDNDVALILQAEKSERLHQATDETIGELGGAAMAAFALDILGDTPSSSYDDLLEQQKQAAELAEQLALERRQNLSPVLGTFAANDSLAYNYEIASRGITTQQIESLDYDRLTSGYATA